VGEHFRLNVVAWNDKRISWLGTDTPAAAIRAIKAASSMADGDRTPEVAIIEELTRKRFAGRGQRVIPHGTVSGSADVDLTLTTSAAPADIRWTQ
jgi:hypothetical protein